MVAVGFTASRDIDDIPIETFVSVLDSLTWATEFITGGARGGDALIGRYLVKRFPETQHTVIVPWNRTQIDDWWSYRSDIKIRVIEMEPGSTYKDRNQAIVDHCTYLCAFPNYDENSLKSKRSGTWQTIRLARKAKKSVYVALLH